MNRIAAAAFIAAGFIAGQPVVAQQSRKPAPTVSPAAAVPVPRADFIQAMDSEFAKMDSDKNRIVTRAEIEQFQRATASLQARATAHALFVKMDTDKNGQLSPAEFEPMVIAPARPNAAPILAQHDLNKDGTITLVEYRTAKLANFDRMDADKDGVVSVSEMKAAGLVR